MKKRLLVVISVVALVVCLSTILFACSSTDKIESKDYEDMEAFYQDALKDVKKQEDKLYAIMDTIEKSSFSATFRLERTYYSTSNDNIVFKGDQEKGGYNNNKEDDGSKWMVDAIDYTFVFNKGNYKITAKVYEPIASNDYNAKASREPIATYTYTKNGELISLTPVESPAEAKYYCFDKMYDVIFGQFSEDEFIESYATSASGGFRFVTHMIQYQMTRAMKYDELGHISNNVISYTENKDKLLYTVLEEAFEDGGLCFYYNGAKTDIAGDDISYWAAYGEDITYNLYKTAAIYNDRVTLTYKNKTKQLQTYEYYGETVLPFYTKKSDFKTYKVLKAVVADYTHFVVEFEYGDVEI